MPHDHPMASECAAPRRAAADRSTSGHIRPCFVERVAGVSASGRGGLGAIAAAAAVLGLAAGAVGQTAGGLPIGTELVENGGFAEPLFPFGMPVEDGFDFFLSSGEVASVDLVPGAGPDGSQAVQMSLFDGGFLGINQLFTELEGGDAIDLSFEVAAAGVFTGSFEFRFESFDLVPGSGPGGVVPVLTDLDGDGFVGPGDADDLFAFDNSIGGDGSVEITTTSPFTPQVGTVKINGVPATEFTDGLTEEFITVTIEGFVVPATAPSIAIVFALASGSASAVLIDNVSVTVGEAPPPGLFTPPEPAPEPGPVGLGVNLLENGDFAGPLAGAGAPQEGNFDIFPGPGGGGVTLVPGAGPDGSQAVNLTLDEVPGSFVGINQLITEVSPGDELSFSFDVATDGSLTNLFEFRLEAFDIVTGPAGVPTGVLSDLDGDGEVGPGDLDDLLAFNNTFGGDGSVGITTSSPFTPAVGTVTVTPEFDPAAPAGTFSTVTLDGFIVPEGVEAVGAIFALSSFFNPFGTVDTGVLIDNVSVSISAFAPEPPAAEPGVNLIENGTFDGGFGGSPEGEFSGFGGGEGGGEIELVPGAGPDGSQAAQLSLDTVSSFVGFSQLVTEIEPGDVISLSFDAATNGPFLNSFEFRFEPFSESNALLDIDGDGGGDKFAFNNEINTADPGSLAEVSPVGTVDIGDGLGPTFETFTITDFVVPEGVPAINLVFAIESFGEPVGDTAVLIDNVVLAVQPDEPPAPTADLDGNGSVDVFDLLGFIALFVSADSAADFDGNGSVDVFDLLGFIALFVSGA